MTTGARSWNRSLALLACGLLAVSLSGCAELLRTRGSCALLEPDRNMRAALPELDGWKVPFVSVGGRHGGFRIEDPNARITVYLANERDRIVAVGPWILIPLPILPTWWAKPDNKLAQACGADAAPDDSTVMLLVQVRPRGACTDSLVRWSPSDVRVTRPGGGKVPVLAVGASATSSQAPVDSAQVENGVRGPVFVRVTLRGPLPVSEAVTLECPDVTLGSIVVRIPPVRFSPGRGWLVTMPRIV
jgi:hypothetical protein